MAIKRNGKKSAGFQPEAFRLGINFKIKDTSTMPMANVDASMPEEVEEVITIEGYANFSGACVDESTTMMDRVGDVVVPSGINIDNYQKSPVILFQHDREYVIGKAVVVTKKLDGLYVTAEIHSGACEEEDFYAIKNGLYTSFSIGFRTKSASWKPIGDTEVYFIDKSELLEISIVSIPCNTDSTFQVVKSFEGNFYAGDVNFTPTPTQPVGSNKTIDGENVMKIALRDMLSEEKVKELEALGLGASLDALQDVDTKSFIESLVAKQFAVLKEEIEVLITEKTKAAEPAAEEEAASAQPTEEAAAKGEGEANEDAVPEVKEEDVAAVKSLSDAVASLKALVIDEK